MVAKTQKLMAAWPRSFSSGRQAVMAKVVNKTSDLVGSAIVDKLRPLAARVKTLTFDNGKEFAGHGQIDEQLQSTAYFARPFASWERGSNENLNGLLRQYIPKKRAMSTVTDEEIRMIQNRLNNKPKKPSFEFHRWDFFGVLRIYFL